MKTVLGELATRTKLALAAGAFLMVLAPTARAQDMAAPAPTQPPPTVASSGGTSATAAPGMKGLSIWGIIPWGGYGAGARFMIPLPIPSLLANARTSLHDNWDLEFGADLLHWSYDFGGPTTYSFHYSWTEVLPVAGVMWNVWFNQNFAIYPKLELGYAFGWFSDWNTGYGASQPAYGGFFIAGDAGALYKLDNGLTLRAELGSDGLKLGAGWLF
jgi:hypothetical protein